MKELLVAFLRKPSLETYRAIRDAVAGDESYDPYSRDLDGLDPLLQQEKHAEVLEAVARGMPNLLLSPRAHLLAGMAHRGMNQGEKADFEFAMAGMCLEGIRMTGDGSPEKPYLVLRISDEYDMLAADGKELQMQALTGRDGRSMDMLTLTDGTVLHFDITGCMAALNRKLGEREPD